MRIPSKIFVLLVAGAACFSSSAAVENAGKPAAATPPLKPSDLFTNAVLAKGKGVAVTRTQLDESLAGLKAGAAARGRPISPAQLNLYERQVLQQLVQIQLLNAKASADDKAAGKETAEKRMAEIKERAGSEQNLELQLKSMEMTPAQLLSRLTEEATADAVLKHDLKTHVTDEDIKKFYDENKAKFEQPEMVRVSHILLSTKDPEDLNPDPSARRDLPEDKKQAKLKQTEELAKRAKAGEDFTKLAKEYSEDPGVKQNNGEYSLSRADAFVPEFKAAAFTLDLKTNQISGIVTTMFGYHILKLNEKMVARTATLDDEVNFTPGGYVIIKQYWNGNPDVIKNAAKLSQIIRQKLESDEQQKLLPEYMDKLVKDAGVQVLDESLNFLAAEPPAVPVPATPAKPPGK